MLKPWQQNTIIVALLALVAFHAAVWLSPASFFGNHSPRYDQSSAEPERENREFLGLAAEGWTALFTAILTGSTLLLWGATRSLVESSEKQQSIANRAFVFLDGFDVEMGLLSDMSKGKWPENHGVTAPELWVTFLIVRPRWRNSGNTPTRNARFRVETRRGSGDALPEPTFEYTGDTQVIFIGPQGVESSEEFRLSGANSVINEGMPKPTFSPILVWGRIDYQDILGDEWHFSKWCYAFYFSRPRARERMTVSYRQWGEYHGTDHDNPMT